jgi:hypothetical protein
LVSSSTPSPIPEQAKQVALPAPMQAPQLAQVTPHLALADVDLEHRKRCLKARSPRHRIAYMGHAIKVCDRYLCRSISQLVFQPSASVPELLFSSLQRSRQQASMRHFDRIDGARSVGTNHHNLSLFRGPHHRFPWPGAVLSFLPQYLQDGAALRRSAPLGRSCPPIGLQTICSAWRSARALKTH